MPENASSNEYGFRPQLMSAMGEYRSNGHYFCSECQRMFYGRRGDGHFNCCICGSYAWHGRQWRVPLCKPHQEETDELNAVQATINDAQYRLDQYKQGIRP